MKKKIIILLALIICILGAALFINNEHRIAFYPGKVKCGIGIEHVDDIINITRGGKYYITGTGEDYTINVDTPNNVTLKFINTNITNDEKIINVIQAKELTLIFEGNNTLTSKNEIAICSLVDTNIRGDGNLSISAKNGIYAKGNLEVYDMTINIESKGDSISANKLTLDNVEFNSKINSDFTLDIAEGRYALIDGNYIKVAKTDVSEYSKLYSLSESGKGIKANEIVIQNSKIEIDTQDDCISANNSIRSENTTFKLSTLDDGLNSDKEIRIDRSNLTILNSFEAIESENILLTNSNITINSIDDGINIPNDIYGAYDNNLLIQNTDLDIIVTEGDGIDISGYLSVFNSKLNIKSTETCIQAYDILMDRANVKLYSTTLGKTALTGRMFGFNGEMLIAQNTKEFMINNTSSKISYIILEGVNGGKIIDKEDNELVIIPDGYPNIVYINTMVNNTDKYYFVSNEGKELINFKGY